MRQLARGAIRARAAQSDETGPINYQTRTEAIWFPVSPPRCHNLTLTWIGPAAEGGEGSGAGPINHLDAS